MLNVVYTKFYFAMYYCICLINAGGLALRFIEVLNETVILMTTTRHFWHERELKRRYQKALKSLKLHFQ